MADREIKRALISVYDKSGVVEFARSLHQTFGVELISTGGTAVALREANLPVTDAASLTGFGAMLDGRVKTLHPAIHAAILADRSNDDHLRQLADANIEPIDMVVVNLYPFADTVASPDCTLAAAVEMIDIGGPCMIRAAAKNHAHVTVVTDPTDYPRITRELSTNSGAVPGELRRELAARAFGRTSEYDRLICDYLAPGAAESPAELPSSLTLPLVCRTAMRYGENPHQSAGWYHDRRSDAPAVRLVVASQSDQSELSYNNYLDADAAIELCADLTRNRIRAFDPAPAPSGRARGSDCAAVLIKHTNPCGVGVATSPVEAFRRAYLGDPKAAMGGICACSFEIDDAIAADVMNALTLWGKSAGAGAFFIEVWIAPRFSDTAVETIRASKKWGQRVRLLERDMAADADSTRHLLRSAAGGVLVQSRDALGADAADWNVATHRQPTDRELADLNLAWICAKHAKSNAIALVRHGRLLAAGAGQTSRVVAAKLAIDLARTNRHLFGDGDESHCVAASDGFFPFRDGPDMLMDAGVTAIIQPGGSKRDADTIAACDQRGVAMILTGTRHFRH